MRGRQNWGVRRSMSTWLCIVGVACSEPGTDTSIDDSDTDTQTVDPVSTVDAAIEQSPIQCEQPQDEDSSRFTNIPFPADNPSWSYLSGYGVAVVDVDLDGDHDIVLPSDNTVYVNQGDGTFTPDTARLPSTDFIEFCSAVTGADYDGDGDFDLFVSLYEYGNRLWRNDGQGHFEDVTATSGIGQNERDTQGSSWADYDGDGDLDLFVANHGFVEPPPILEYGPADANELYLNNGDGTFTDISDRMAVTPNLGYTFQGLWFDFDGDRDLDLYVVNDFGQVISNKLLYNENGQLVLAEDQRGLDVSLASMGFAVGDVNRDAIPDFFISAWKEGTLLLSVAPQWFDFTDAVGIINELTLPRIGWGSWFSDFDSDGDQDLYVLYGFLDTHWPNPEEQLDSLFVQGDNLMMTDEASGWSLTSQDARRGLIVADVNADGWPDAAYTSVLGDHGVLLSNCGDAAWLRVSLEQPGMNRWAISATVQVGVNGEEWTEWIWAGGVGFAGSGPPEALIGLGQVDQVDYVKVTWPDGETTVVNDVATRQSLHITRQ